MLLLVRAWFTLEGWSAISSCERPSVRHSKGCCPSAVLSEIELEILMSLFTKALTKLRKTTKAYSRKNTVRVLHPGSLPSERGRSRVVDGRSR